MPCTLICVSVHFLYLGREAQILPCPRAAAGELDTGQLAEGKGPWAPSSCPELSSLCPLSAGHGWPSPSSETPVGKGRGGRDFSQLALQPSPAWFQVLPSLTRLPPSAHGHHGDGPSQGACTGHLTLSSLDARKLLNASNFPVFQRLLGETLSFEL